MLQHWSLCNCLEWFVGHDCGWIDIPPWARPRPSMLTVALGYSLLKNIVDWQGWCRFEAFKIGTAGSLSNTDTWVERSSRRPAMLFCIVFFMFNYSLKSLDEDIEIAPLDGKVSTPSLECSKAKSWLCLLPMFEFENLQLIEPRLDYLWASIHREHVPLTQHLISEPYTKGCGNRA